jgi:hypothetical protein
VKALLLVFLFFISHLSFATSHLEVTEEAFDAIRKGDIEIVRDLVSKGLDPNYLLGKPGNVMRLAAFYKRPEILSYLISVGGNVDHEVDGRMHFISFVASREQFELLKVVVNEEADLNKLIYFDQYTIFISLLRKIDVQGLEYILDVSSVDVNFRPDNGFSPLYHLYERGSCGLKCLKILLENCANPNLEIGKDALSFKEHVAHKRDQEALNLINGTKCKKER